MSELTITILESDITGQSATTKAVVITCSGKPNVEIPFSAGQSFNIVQTGANYQLTTTDAESQWIIESTDLVALEARKTALKDLVPANNNATGAVNTNIVSISNVDAAFTAKSVTTSLTTIMDTNANRKMFTIRAKNGDVWVSIGDDAEVDGDTSILLSEGDTMKSDLICETGIITGITESGTTDLVIQEA